MKCKKCGSNNVDVVMDINQSIKKVNHLRGLLRCCMILITCGLWWLLVPKKVLHTRSQAVALCQNCGNRWKVNG